MGAAFNYMRGKFPKLSEAKIKEGIFVGPQIRELLRDEQFDSVICGREKAAWNALRLVVKNFLGNFKAENYRELVDNLLYSYNNLGCNMSLKMHFLHSHLNFSRKLWRSKR